MHAAIMSLLLAGCPADPDAPPEKLVGLWELHQVETSQGEIDSLAVVLADFPSCVWGRRTFLFGDGMLRVQNDVLCPSAVNHDEFYGCEVAVEVPAVWDDTDGSGKWVVSTRVSATARTKGLEAGSLDVPTTCTVAVAAGTYPVASVRGYEWRWEIQAPDGQVYRLRDPPNDNPDFVAALRGAPPPPPPPMPEEGEEGAEP